LVAKVNQVRYSRGVFHGPSLLVQVEFTEKVVWKQRLDEPLPLPSSGTAISNAWEKSFQLQMPKGIECEHFLLGLRPQTIPESPVHRHF
jgi:hypothetical protein